MTPALALVAEARERGACSLDLGGRSDVDGEVIKAVGRLETLQELSLRGCPGLKNSHLKALAGLGRLQRLDLSDSDVSGGLAPLQGLPLVELRLERLLELKASGLKPVGGIPSLERLSLAGSGATDKATKLLEGLSRLVELDVSWDRACIRQRRGLAAENAVPFTQALGSAGLRHLEGLPLARLVLRHHYLNPRVLKRIAKLSALRQLDLSGCEVDDEEDYRACRQLGGVTKLEARRLNGFGIRLLLGRMAEFHPLEEADFTDSGFSRVNPRDTIAAGKSLRRVVLPLATPDAELVKLRRQFEPAVVERQPSRGWIAFARSPALGSAKATLNGRVSISTFKDPVAVRVPEGELTVTVGGVDHPYRPLQIQPTEEEALASPVVFAP